MFNSFTLCWFNFCPSIFPPVRFIGRVLNKILSDKVEKAILIVPLWKTQSWFPLLISSLISIPARLPRHKDLLVMPHTGENHPLIKKMSLIACIVSGNISKIKDFRNMNLMSSTLHSDISQLNNISIVGENGFIGAVNGKLIPITHLK